MSLIRDAFIGASWLAFFKIISQTFSWAATIIVARNLIPEDYGLMEMATVLIGYVLLFCDLGLGMAIVQREEISQQELSSLFWFVTFWGSLLSIICFLLAYPTVALFNEGRILRITQLAMLLFILGSILTVPTSILGRELRFKTLGFIDAISVIVSSIAMVAVAKLGGGVWTLIGGFIIRDLAKIVLTFFLFPWRPQFHFKFEEVRTFMKFGLNLAFSQSLYYMYTKSDRFFGGRVVGANNLGFYSLALQLSDIPTEKLVSLINGVSYPIFARYQRMQDEFNVFFLKLINITSFITFPVYIGGIFIADEIITAILGVKWVPIIPLFKMLCMSQLIISITTVNSTVNNAQGRPHWNLYVSGINTILLPVSFFIAAQHGIFYLTIPWISVNPLIRLGYTYLTLRKMGVSKYDYLKSFIHPILGTCVMLCFLVLSKYLYFGTLKPLTYNLERYLLVLIIIGIVSYLGYTFIFNKKFISEMKKLIGSR